MKPSPWLQKIATQNRWPGRVVLFVSSLVVLAFTFGIVFPWLAFGNLNPWFLVTNTVSGAISAYFLGERFRLAVVRRGALHFLWLGPFYSWLTAQCMALLGMLFYTIEQQFDPNARDGNPIFGLITLILFYTPIAFGLGIFSGLWLRRWVRKEVFN
jgi:hypothetical protein